MPLRSRLFKGDPKLEAAAVSNPAHILLGAQGPHVEKIQSALILLDDATIATRELALGRYGPATAQAVLAYKSKRNIINRNYQSRADDIVGVMTMAALDSELVLRESRYAASRGCGDPVSAGGGPHASVILAFSIPATMAPAASMTVAAAAPSDLNVVLLWTKGALASTTSQQWHYFDKARELLGPTSLNLVIAPAPAVVPHDQVISAANKYDIWDVRKAAEKVMPGLPATLRIIATPFETTNPPFYAVTESGSWDGSTFVDFILLNARLVRSDQCTVIHEMLHASSRADGKPAVIDRFKHDTDPASIYSEGSARTVLKPEHVQALSDAYFARRR